MPIPEVRKGREQVIRDGSNVLAFAISGRMLRVDSPHIQRQRTMPCAVGSQSSSARVLLINPHADTAELYAWALQNAGFEVCLAPLDGTRPVTCNPDLAIACMRHADGALVRRMVPDKRIPTILLTGWVQRGTAAHHVDCDALMMIPVSPAELTEKVQEMLELVKRRDELAPVST
jgi:response regulator RpfG family c-di-GMP phosphodiesterase